MKRWIVSMSMVCVLVAPVCLLAQDAPQGRSPDQILKVYDAKLILTEDQKLLLRPLIADRQLKIKELRQDQAMRPREKLKKLESITDNVDKKINAVLTSGQRPKYAEMEKEMMDQIKERRQRGKAASN